MSYAIIRNTNYKIKNLSGIYRHNERKNTHYSNKDINRQNSTKNYSIKTPYSTYEKMFKDIKKEHNLKGQIKKVSNVMCELVITSDREFFDTIGEEETKRYFQTAYEFVEKYQNLGEDYIVSAKVHMDESTPHLHLVFIPVIHKFDSKSGKYIDKIACSEYWKGKDSYHKLQDSFYEYVTSKGFNLERGKNIDNEHIQPEDYKRLINYDEQNQILENEKIKEVDENNLSMVVAQNKSLKLYVNKLKMKLHKANKVIEMSKDVEKENIRLHKENQELKSKISYLTNYIEKTFEVVNILFDVSVSTLKNIVNNFINSTKDLENNKKIKTAKKGEFENEKRR